MDRFTLRKGSDKGGQHLVSELQHPPFDNEISNEKLVQTKANVNNHDKGIEIMENIQTLKQILPTSTTSSSMDIFIF